MYAPNFPALLNDLGPELDRIRGSLITGIVALSAAGVTAMALVQTFKDQLPLRAWYQRFRICGWIQEGIDDIRAQKAKLSPSTQQALDTLDVASVEGDIICLATDRDRKAFYGLEIEKLCGQLNSAVQTILQSPGNYLPAFLVLASEVNPAIINAFLDGPGPGALTQPPTPQQAAFIAARTQITQQIQRAVDALQISVAADWQTHLQQASLLISIAISEWVIVCSNTLKADLGNLRLLYGLLFGVLSGFLAPVSRDLISALQNLRD